ncbi:hypothetical protein GR183_04615 [Stappia sp. GBMRC 2046]|uniref:Uncharacterized protein n=1 Tax=Stappia sediminis TaxID=2692190 RepID=A0A7X3LSB8_9HYPH|nr:hypothetical protein [Stappia sediminis]MXN64176.1 hypothetical protein [Stappia sediminis]
MALDVLIILTVLATGALLWLPGVKNAAAWRAAVTPLASIIGSGFLVLGPILDFAYGKWAPAAMAGLCVIAYLLGSAIRYNIVHQQGAGGTKLTRGVDVASSAVLAFAYVISVAYYLNLFGAFGLSLVVEANPSSARLLTSAVFAVILFFGWTGGFKSLEGLEYASVSLKLAIIAGLLIGLGEYFFEKTANGELVLNDMNRHGWAGLTLAFGLIITVQGFETSRYLGGEYNAQVRARSMRLAQLLSTLIYMIYIVLLAYIFKRGDLKLSETAIVDMTRVVAAILPFFLVAAALAAQFSAAVADTSGSGGLVEEFTGGKVSQRGGYAILVVIGLAITWSSSVFQIISYASRAFAMYYCLQAFIAAILARKEGASLRFALYSCLSLLSLAIVIFGTSVENGTG